MTKRSGVALIALTLLIVGSMASLALAGDPEIDAQVRVREYVLLNHDFNSDADDQNNWAAMRTRVGLKFDAGRHTRAYVQFQDTRALGEPANTLTSLEQVDLHQAYIMIRDVYDAPLHFQIGRMEMNYGAQRQVGAVGWNDVGRSFDGVRMIYEIEDFGWFHTFAMKINETGGVGSINSGAGITASGNEQAFLGAYLHYDAESDAALEVYLFDLYTDAGDLLDGESATGNLFTAGVRATWHDEDMGVKLYGEGAFQFGSAPDYDGMTAVQPGPDYNAYAGVAGLKYMLPSETPTWLNFEYNIASGDDGSDPTEVTTYTQLFPTVHAPLGAMDFVSWTNIMSFQGTFGVMPSDSWKLWASYHYFQVMEEADAWYSLGGITAGTRLLGDAAYDSALGSEIDVSAKYTVDENLSFLAIFGMWMPGTWQEQATSGSVDDPAELDPAYTIYVQTTATF